MENQNDEFQGKPKNSYITSTKILSLLLAMVLSFLIFYGLIESFNWYLRR